MRGGPWIVKHRMRPMQHSCNEEQTGRVPARQPPTRLTWTPPPVCTLKEPCWLSESAAGGRSAGLQKEIPELVEERGRRGWADCDNWCCCCETTEWEDPLGHREKPAAATWARSLEPVGTPTRLGAALPSLGGSWLSVCGCDASLGAAGARSREPAGPLVHRENLTVCDEVATIWRGPA